jgi:hypothetical protein
MLINRATIFFLIDEKGIEICLVSKKKGKLKTASYCRRGEN